MVALFASSVEIMLDKPNANHKKLFFNQLTRVAEPEKFEDGSGSDILSDYFLVPAPVSGH